MRPDAHKFLGSMPVQVDHEVVLDDVVLGPSSLRTPTREHNLENSECKLVPGHVEVTLVSKVVEVPAISCINGRTNHQASKKQCQ